MTAFAASDELLWLGTQPDFGGATNASRAHAAGATDGESIPWLAVLDIRDPLRPRLAGSIEVEDHLSTSHTNVFDLLTVGDRVIALGFGFVPLPVEDSFTIAPRAISIAAYGAGERLEVEDVVDFPATPDFNAIWPFMMASAGGRLWLGSVGYPVKDEDAQEYGLIAVALDDATPMEIVGTYRLPASVLARMSDNLSWLQHEVVEVLRLDGLGERLLVSRIEGGVAAIDTRLEPPRWIPPPVLERVGR